MQVMYNSDKKIRFYKSYDWFSPKRAILKRIIILFTIIVCAQTVNAQIQSNCNANSVLLKYYDKDIKHLALKRVFDVNSSYKDSIIIPESYQDTIRKGLAAIYNITTLDERDSVFDNYCIHQEISYSMFKKINVGVDASCPWLQQWQDLKTTTGNTALDNLLSKYGFTVTSFFKSIRVASLTTTQDINVRPLCDLIEKFEGVKYAEPSPPAGDGDEIIYKKVGNDRFYDFTLGYGDCQSGCIGEHTFKFKVDNNCAVDFLGVFDRFISNTPIPKPINCNITKTSINNSIIKESIKIYPNPANNNIFVESNQNGKVEIFNLQGQLIVNTTINETITKVDMSNLPRGVCIVKATFGNEVVIKKVIKQ